MQGCTEHIATSQQQAPEDSQGNAEDGGQQEGPPHWNQDGLQCDAKMSPGVLCACSRVGVELGECAERLLPYQPLSPVGCLWGSAGMWKCTSPLQGAGHASADFQLSATACHCGPSALW